MAGKQKVNTTEGLKKVTLKELDNEIKKAAKVLGEEKKVEVQIPAYLQERLGAVVPVAVNGAVIQVPVGEKVKIPESMAKVLNESLNNLTL